MTAAALAALVYYIAVKRIDAGNFEAFKRAVDEQAEYIERDLRFEFDQVYDLSKIFNTKEDVTEQDLYAYMTQKDFDEHPSFYNFGWVARVPYSQKTEFELTARRQGILPDFFIFEKSGGKDVAVAPREEYFPFYYRKQENEGNIRIKGFDIASDPTRRKTLEKARDTGMLAATEAIELITNPGLRAIQIYMPVYYGSPKTLEERRADLRGFTFATFWLHKIFEHSFNSMGRLNELAAFDILSQGITEDKGLLYRHTPSGGAAMSKLAYVKTIKAAGQTLQIKAVPTVDYLMKMRGWQPIADAAAVLIIVWLVGGFIANTKTHNARLKAEVAAKTVDLRESEKKYRRLVELSQEGIWAVDNDNLTVFANQALADMLGFTVEEMMGTLFLDYLDDESRAKASNSMKYQIQTGKTDRLEVVLKHKTGKAVSASVSAVSIIDEPGRYGGAVAVVSDITRRKELDNQLRRSLAEKEVLLKEIHHRVKNNLQIVSALIGMQMDNVSDERYYAMFQDSQRRIQSIALIHERLYRSEGFTNIDMRQYVADLTKEYFRNFTINNKEAVIKIEVDQIAVGIDIAVPCGLIINELITNIVKHAFPVGSSCLVDKTCEVHIAIRCRDDANTEAAVVLDELWGQPGWMPPYAEQLELTVADNGVGIPEGIDLKKSKSLGMTIVNLLVRQLGGSIELDRTNGSKFTVKFKNL